MRLALAMDDFAIVTFAVTPSRVASLLPDGFSPLEFDLDDGRRSAFVSAVVFRVVGMGTAPRPMLPIRYTQINYRAYVRREGRECVWFFGSSVTSLSLALCARTFGLPWRFASIRLRSRWDGDSCTTYELDARGRWGEAQFACTGTNLLAGRIDGFRDASQTRTTLTGPREGYGRVETRRTVVLDVDHAPVYTLTGRAQVARFQTFEDLGLISRQDHPHSVLLACHAPAFLVTLPPRALAR